MNIFRGKLSLNKRAVFKLLLLMNLKIFFLLLGIMPASASIYSQNTKLDISVQNYSLEDIFSQIETQSEFTFLYSVEDIEVYTNISVDVQGKTVEEILDKCLEYTGLTYGVDGKLVIIRQMDTVAVPEFVPQEKKEVQGTVTDENGQSIPGVNVVIKGTTSGTSTDIDGKFSIMVDNLNVTLSVSFIGYIPQDLALSGKTAIDIVLVEDSQTLADVVVVGYGTQTRQKMTSSVSTISSEDLKSTPVANLENALGGKMSGVFMRQTSGEPGVDGADIRIRGFGSALVVVDGIPGRDYSNIDPNEIESISVLKDAASASIYGMQGANGVILVTTKQGKNKAPVVEFNSYVGFQSPTRYPQPMGSTDWQHMQNAYRANNKLLNDPNAISEEQDLDINPGLPNTNWYKETVKEDSKIVSHNVNVSGGSENVNYFLSAGYLKQGGIWATDATKKKRYNLRANLDIKVNDFVSVGANVSGIFNNLDYPGASQNDIGSNIRQASPIYSVSNDRGYTYVNVKDGYNPAAMIDPSLSGYASDKSRDWNIDLSFDYKIPFIKGLSYKGVLAYNTHDNDYKSFNKKLVFYNELNGEYEEVISKDGHNKTSLGLSNTANDELTLQSFLNYKNSFGSHNISGSAIYEQTTANSHYFNTGRGTFPSDAVDMIYAGMDDDNKWNGESAREYASQSYIGKLSYDFDTKYLIEFAARYDGAQYFAPDNRWGFFPSVSAGWMMSKENFMEPISHIVSELKIRGSWGQLGDLSAAKGYYSYNEDYYWAEGYKYPGGVLQIGSEKIYMLEERLEANPDFTWAKSTMYNFGIDAKLWNNLLSVNADVFYRKRTDLPAQKTDDNSGNLATYYNLNGDNTRGFEMSLNHSNNINDFNYSVSANMSWSRTKNGHTEQRKFTSGYDAWRNKAEGNWTNVTWGVDTDGQYQDRQDILDAPYLDGQSKVMQMPGDVNYKDWNGDGYIDSKDSHPISASAYPEFIYGVTISMDYKGFDLSMFWQGSAKSSYYISGSSTNPFKMNTPDKGTFDYLGSYWRKADYTSSDDVWIAGDYPAYRDGYTEINNYMTNTFWKRNGAYVRLKNIQIGYSLPESVLSKVGLKKARIYVQAYNWLTFNSTSYIDPETKGGQEIGDYPQIKSFNVGVNLKF